MLNVFQVLGSHFNAHGDFYDPGRFRGPFHIVEHLDHQDMPAVTTTRVAPTQRPGHGSKNTRPHGNRLTDIRHSPEAVIGRVGMGVYQPAG